MGIHEDPGGKLPVSYSEYTRYKWECARCRKTFWESIKKCCPARLEECKTGCNHAYTSIGMGVFECRYCGEKTTEGKIGC